MTHQHDIASIAKMLEIQSVGEGRPVLLLHGIQGTLQSWARVLPVLHGVNVHMPNLPGRGRSPRAGSIDPAWLYSIDTYSQLIREVVIDISRQTGSVVDVVGWSMGVTVLLELYRKTAGDGIGRIALLSGTPMPSEARWFSSAERDRIEQEAIERAKRMRLVDVAEPTAVSFSLQSARSFDHREMLASIDRPLLVVHGTADDQSPYSHGALIAASVPGSRLVALNGAGHSILLENAKEVGESLNAFLLG